MQVENPLFNFNFRLRFLTVSYVLVKSKNVTNWRLFLSGVKFLLTRAFFSWRNRSLILQKIVKKNRFRCRSETCERLSCIFFFGGFGRDIRVGVANFRRPYFPLQRVDKKTATLNVILGNLRI